MRAREIIHLLNCLPCINKDVCLDSWHQVKQEARGFMEETCAWYYKSGQELMAEELTGPKHEPTTIILLIAHSFKLISKSLAL